MKTIGVTFGTPEYAGSLAALRHSALTTGEFDEFHVFEPKDIEWLMQTYPEHFVDGTRGFGWWCWKPFLIRNVMSQQPDDTVIVYTDSTMIFERSIKPYATHVQTRPILLQRLGNWSDPKNDYRVKKWTKKSILNRLGGPDAGDSIMLDAAFQVYKNCPESRAFVDQYLKWCLELDMVNDSGKDGDVIDCRHDQSILSVLAHDHPGITLCRNVTQWGRIDPRTDDVIEVDSRDDSGVMHNLVNHHRRQLRLPKLAVITPTTGGTYLEECIESVQKSTLPNIEHWIVVDGKDLEPKVDAIISKFEGKHPLVKLVLPKNIGYGGWNGHRVYGSVPFLIDSDYIAYLDDDNVVSPTQYADLVRETIRTKSKWGFCLRYLINSDGERVGLDNCESLGGISHSVYGPGNYLIDTSCYLIERDLAIAAGPIWNARFRDPDGKPEPDRELCKTLLASAPHAVIRKHHLGYRLGSTERSVKPQFFEQGNKTFGYDFEKFQDIYIFHFSRTATENFLHARKQYTNRSFALDEWQMTLLRGLDGCNDGKYNLLNGFTNFPNIPEGATILVTLCNPADLPLDFLKQRKDLRRIVYTLESPNIRHAGQWNPVFLKEHFDVAITYFEPLLKNMPSVFAPHNCHHGTFEDPMDRAALLRDNNGKERSVGLVLERRPELFNKPDYSVMGVRLRCLDHLREKLVKGQKNVTVFGMNWASVADGVHVKLGHGNHRSKDNKSTVDHKQNFVFDLIVENCDAPGYVSEKFYDALSAGCIPLYYGNMFDKLSELIPEGRAYFDLKKRNIETGEELQKLIDSLKDDDISIMRENVVKYRERVLEFAGANNFARAVEQAIQVAQNK